MIIETAKLECAVLDWAVGKAVNDGVRINLSIPYGGSIPDGPAFIEIYEEEPWPGADDGYMPYSPSTNWSVGGPLIEQYKAEFRVRGDFYECRIEMWDDEGIGYDEIKTTGADHLTAAMRAIVAAKLGDTVDVPEDLCQ